MHSFFVPSVTPASWLRRDESLGSSGRPHENLLRSSSVEYQALRCAARVVVRDLRADHRFEQGWNHPNRIT
jgi:hypothetical protein